MPSEEKRYRLPDGTWAAWCTANRKHWCYLCNSTITAGEHYRRTKHGKSSVTGTSLYRHACEGCAQIDDVERALLGPDEGPDDDRMNPLELDVM